MEITRADAVRVLVGLGWVDAGNWSKSKVQSRLDKLHESVGDEQTIGDDDLDNLLDELIGCGAEGEPIVLTIIPQGKQVAVSAPQSGPSKSDEPVAMNGKAKEKVAKQSPPEETTDADDPWDVPPEEKPQKKLKGTPKAAPVKVKELPAADRLMHVRPAKGRPYFAGVVLREFGLEKGVTNEMVARLDKLVGGVVNTKESLAWLKNAWHIARGYEGEAK